MAERGLLRPRLISRSVAFLLGGVPLYLLAPAVLEVFSSWGQVSKLKPRWFVAVGLAQVAVFFASTALQRVALRTSEWGPVATSQLAGNAAARMVPGGAATGAALQFKLLRDAGVRTDHASIGLVATGVLQFAGGTGTPDRGTAGDCPG